jgi:hypothetical protein
MYIIAAAECACPPPPPGRGYQPPYPPGGVLKPPPTSCSNCQHQPHVSPPTSHPLPAAAVNCSLRRAVSCATCSASFSAGQASLSCAKSAERLACAVPKGTCLGKPSVHLEFSGYMNTLLSAANWALSAHCMLFFKHHDGHPWPPYMNSSGQALPPEMPRHKLSPAWRILLSSESIYLQHPPPPKKSMPPTAKSSSLDLLANAYSPLRSITMATNHTQL